MIVMREDLSELLEIAKYAAGAAAAVHRSAVEVGDFNVDTKRSTCDLVTEIDRAAEREIVTAIRTARPDDEIVGEEGADFRGSSGVSGPGEEGSVNGAGALIQLGSRGM